MSIAHIWGSTAEERTSAFPCDELAGPEALACFRAVGVDTPASVLFPWLCQLRVAPYSYDWIDNWGRRSPQTLTPGLDELEVGQAMMVFQLASFERDRHVTMQTKKDGRFGSFFVTYRIDEHGPERCRLVVKLSGRFPGGLLGRLLAAIFPWADLIMMRRQLLNLKALAERDARAGEH